MAPALGRGGKTAVAEASGLGRNTVAKGEREVTAGIEPSQRLRAPGAGDKPAIDKQPGLLEALDELVWPETRGHPESPLRWTLTSTYELARQLTAQGFRVSAELVRRLLHQMGYSLQAPPRWSRGRRTPTATPSSPTSTASSPSGSPPVSRSSRSTPRRRNSSATTRTAGGTGGRPGIPSGSTCTTSPTSPWGSTPRRSPIGATTSATTKAGDRSGMSRTPPRSRARRSAAGGPP